MVFWFVWDLLLAASQGPEMAATAGRPHRSWPAPAAPGAAGCGSAAPSARRRDAGRRQAGTGQPEPAAARAAGPLQSAGCVAPVVRDTGSTRGLSHPRRCQQRVRVAGKCRLRCASCAQTPAPCMDFGTPGVASSGLCASAQPWRRACISPGPGERAAIGDSRGFRSVRSGPCRCWAAQRIARSDQPAAGRGRPAGHRRPVSPGRARTAENAPIQHREARSM